MLSSFVAKVLFLFPTDSPHPGRDVITVKLNDCVQWEGPGGGSEGGKGEGGEGRKVLIETVHAEFKYHLCFTAMGTSL